MSLIRLYIFHEKIVLPVVAETEAGFYVDVEPIQVFSISDKNAWKNAVYSTLSKGNPVIPTPDGSEEPGSAILEKLNIQKWSTFETSATMYTVHLGGGYIRIYKTGRGADGMWSNSENSQRQFAGRAPLSSIVDSLADDILKQPEANRPKTSLMLSPAAPPRTLPAPLPETPPSATSSAPPLALPGPSSEPPSAPPTPSPPSG